MPRYENNRYKLNPYRQNFHYEDSDYNEERVEGNFTSERLPYENDDDGSYRREAWDIMDQQKEIRNYSSKDIPEYNNKNRYFDVHFSRYMDRRYEGHHGKGPKGWRRSDERIKEDVNEALYRSHEVDASDVEVNVSEGVVTLKGFVTSRYQKRDAEECIENLSGVVDVRNELQVRR